MCACAWQTIETAFGGENGCMLEAAEDVLALQQKYHRHHQQLLHKEQMIKGLMSNSVKCVSDIDDYWLQKQTVAEVIRSW
jgi:hypothetical protein